MLSQDILNKIATDAGLDYPRIMAFLSVESSGEGFHNGKILIQFEPTHFASYLTKQNIPHTFSSSLDTKGRKLYVLSAKGITFDNGVEGQDGEWEAFNKAFSIDAKGALLSTSIGIMQVLGENYKIIGYTSVNDMWDDFKKGEEQQVKGGVNYIKAIAPLYTALCQKDWDRVAYYYNGPNYKDFKYDTRLEAAYNTYSKI